MVRCKVDRAKGMGGDLVFHLQSNTVATQEPVVDEGTPNDDEEIGERYCKSNQLR